MVFGNFLLTTDLLIQELDSRFCDIFLRSAEKIESLEEERRLMYVASTRAKQNLFVTYPMNMYDREAGTTFSKPSRFISEISSDKAEGWLVEDEF